MDQVRGKNRNLSHRTGTSSLFKKGVRGAGRQSGAGAGARRFRLTDYFFPAGARAGCTDATVELSAAPQAP